MEKDFIVVRNVGLIKRIETSQILFILSDGDCSTYHLQNGVKFSCSKSLRKIEDSLPLSFVRIRKDCLVNTYNISEFKVRHRTIVLLDGSIQEVSCRKVRVLGNALVG
jgi:DNA-binding LytR/AlgR family response regulator